MANVMKQLQAGNHQRCEVVSHDKMFQPVYQMLLALHTAAACLPAQDCLPSLWPLCQQAVEELSEVAVHPVVAALLASAKAMWAAASTTRTPEV